MSSTPLVVAVVLHYEREAHTITCVRALERSTGITPRILIVDNHSRDGSGDRLRTMFPQHDHLQTGENLGYAGGNARGTAWALEHRAEFVLVLNDDVEVEPSTVASLVAALQKDPESAAVGPTVRFNSHDGPICWDGGEIDLLRALGTSTLAPGRTVTFISGACVMIRAEALRANGSFNADYFAYVEDVELSLRYVRARWRLLREPATTVVHHTPYPEPPTAPWKIRLRDLNRRRLVDEHYTTSEHAKFALWFYPTRVLLMLGYFVRLDFARLAAVWRGMTGSIDERSRP